MNGFKSGATDSGLNEEDEAGDEEESRDEEQETRQAAREQDDTDSGLPYIYARNSSTDGREAVQLHRQPDTVRKEQDVYRSAPVEENLKKADFREAAYLAGLQHLDKMLEYLEEWGYDVE